MRLVVRALPLGILWAIGLYPIALVLLDRIGPPLAVRTALAVEVALGAAFWPALAAAALALLWPPVPALLRLLVRNGIDRLRCDRTPLRRAVAELRHVETAARRLEAGRAALAVHDAAAALPHLLRAIELEPDQAAAHHQLGLAHQQRGDFAAAAAALERAVQLDPGQAFGGAMRSLGQALLQERRFRAAADVLQRHVREHGGNRGSHYWLGVSLRALGDRPGARAAFAVAAAPPPPRPRLTASENWFRARARVALWTLGGAA